MPFLNEHAGIRSQVFLERGCPCLRVATFRISRSVTRPEGLSSNELTLFANQEQAASQCHSW